MEIGIVGREEWVNSLTDLKEDRFAKTFLGKADSRGYWDRALGCYINGILVGGIITTYSKREPKTANLQLLHTFYKYRGKGIGKELTLKAVKDAYDNDCKYFRVSAEPKAVAFYEKIGFQFWGKQKSGTSLSIFRLESPNLSEGIYEIEDSTIYNKVYKNKGRIYETK